jgi:xylulokinase
VRSTGSSPSFPQADPSGESPPPLPTYPTNAHAASSLDNKLFSFQGDSFHFSHVKSIYRFETGIKVTEFRDLRANPHYLLERQILSFRVKWSRMLAAGLNTQCPCPHPLQQQPQPHQPQPQPHHQQPQPPTQPHPHPHPHPFRPSQASLGLSFDPYDQMPLPARILATSAAANFPSVVNLVGDVFNAHYGFCTGGFFVATETIS